MGNGRDEGALLRAAAPAGGSRLAGEVTPRDIHASVGRRAAALLLDTVLIGVVYGVLAIPLVYHDNAATAALHFLGVLLITAAYFTLGNGGAAGQTIGKKALGIAVRDEVSFAPIGYRRGFFRWLFTFMLWCFFLLPGLLDGLAPLGSAKRKSWHDMVVSSIVVNL